MHMFKYILQLRGTMVNQHVKALQAASISPFVILLPPNQPMNECKQAKLRNCELPHRFLVCLNI